MVGRCSRRCPGNSSTLIASTTPGLLRSWIRASARLQLVRSQSRSIRYSSQSSLSCRRPATLGSIPSPAASGNKRPPVAGKTSTIWVFWRIPFARSADLLATPSVRVSCSFGPTLPPGQVGLLLP